jgi:diguanylate cyclase (GGDEF)-like protein
MAEKRVAELVAAELRDTERAAEAIGRAIERRFVFLRGVPSLLADEEGVRSAIASGSDSKSNALGRRLARTARELELNAAWVTNSDGVCIAAANFDKPDNVVGTNFSDREYFQSAQRGERGQHYAVSRRMQTPALFFSAPVLIDGRFAGAVAIKMDLPRLSEWVTGTDSFITDENGVIILASDARLENRVMPGSPVYALPDAARMTLYHRTDFAEVPVRTAGDPRHPRLIRFNDEPRPQVAARVPVPGTVLTVHVLSRVDHIDRMRTDRLSAFYLIAFGGIVSVALILGVILQTRRSNSHRAELSASNAALSDLNERLEHEASTDTLTRCANRRRFIEALGAELARARRHGYTLSVLVADIDHFKRVNDVYGHAAGDHALRHFAAIAARSIRSEDLLARLGGEEFVVLLPETDQGRALILADRIRAAIEATPLTLPEGSIAMTVSIGVGTLSAAEATPESLLQHADKALYMAKERGRNRVVPWTMPLAA